MPVVMVIWGICNGRERDMGVSLSFPFCYYHLKNGVQGQRPCAIVTAPSVKARRMSGISGRANMCLHPFAPSRGRYTLRLIEEGTARYFWRVDAIRSKECVPATDWGFPERISAVFYLLLRSDIGSLAFADGVG